MEIPTAVLCACVFMTALLCVCLFVQKPQPLATLHDVVASVFGLVVGAATILATTTLY